ncbi:tRNA (guanosine(37)-N1)-methyltransferase TrmD [Nocardioides sp. TRM66260-LWL]|uniref:tRNA (guanosine(37)-N1)-methyltransferase TrmD n=1 Tax=Nocardioides sp. TRM66260-LWL TaxID=2874478 RepID=UPI001CC6F223|nr:tRNA (guanosine(37)-N1)-methyltransferase TrmD [Nocardioides sp. TRM66260-LWL]MBZ5733167.1 tRNA (guanosine(37)-N1)-methyltransferase TrmD [Nocardioides sp. TRM66260-LWL]
MRLDYLTIFPDYLAPLRLSLPGKALASGLIDVHVHDLRAWTHDRHRTVDDTPYGGGAGMVMRPEPWGEAFDALAIDGATVVVPTPSGRPLTQALARELATRERLVFCCGRYEGIDQRVLDHAGSRAELVEISLGDYVLNGGEVAALAVTEAVVRLLPGFMGNAASLVEESHEDGLLEYPSYTKPPSWRGLDVPDVLLSGDHGRIAAWRHEQRLGRTAERRPDLLAAGSLAPTGEWTIEPAQPADAPELLVLQRCCWVTEALANDDLSIPPLHEELGDIEDGLRTWRTWTVRLAGRLVGSVRGRVVPGSEEGGDTWEIGRLMVAPDLRGRGLGRVLLEHAEAMAPASTRTLLLFTGARSEANLRRYRRAGYRVREVLDGPSGPVVLTRPRRR